MDDPTATRDARWLRAGVAGVWLWTAVAVVHPAYRAIGADYLGRLGLPPWPMYVADGAELVLGLWVLRGPTTPRLAAVQLIAVTGFTVALAAVDPMLLVSPFGMLSKNLPLATVVIGTALLEREGWTRRVEAILTWGMAVPWLTEGLVPKLLFQQPAELALVPRLGLGCDGAVVAALGVAEIAAGLGLLLLPRRPRAWLLAALAAALVLLPLVVGALLPVLWVHPFGPLSKNLPLLAGTIVLYRRCSS